MPALFQTDNAELAARRMWERNADCVLYRRHELLRHIPFKTSQIADLRATYARAWDDFFDRAVADWRQVRGMLVYCPMRQDRMPRTEAVLFPECPLSYSKLEALSDRITREIIIYRPPDWSMHEEMLDFKAPLAALYSMLLTVIDGIFDRPLSEREACALAFSGFDPRMTIVFSAQTITDVCGIEERQLKQLLAYKFKGYYMRFQCVTPLLEPDDVADQIEYHKLLDMPDAGGGIRFLPMGIGISASALRRLVRGCYVSRAPDVYMMRAGWKYPNMGIIDAVANVRRGDWYKIKSLVESAPKYDLSPHIPLGRPLVLT